MGLLSKAVSGSSSLNEPSLRGGLLKIISDKQNPDSAPLPSSPLEKAVMEKLSVGYEKYGEFQGIVLEALKYSAGEFTGRLSFMVSGFGIAQGLAPGRCMVMFNSAQDAELIGQHLAKTVPGNNIFCFQAKNPAEAFSLIKSYL